jgi:aminopeptidase N
MRPRIPVIILFLVCIFSGVFAQTIVKPYCSHVSHLRDRARLKSMRTQSAPDNYDVKFYFLDIEADNQSSFIKARVSMKAQVKESLSQIVVDLSDQLQVDSVFVNDVKVAFSHAGNAVSFSSNGAKSVGDFFTSTIYYQGNGQNQSFFSGISNAASPKGGRITWTLSEPQNALDWFACKQSLDDKADSAYIYVTVPSNLKAGSNGLLKNVSDVPANRKRYEWKTYYPIAYYLISITVGEFDEYNTTATVDGKEMLIQNYVYPNTLGALQSSLDETGPMIEKFSELYGAYPFANEKYGHAMAPLGGGMEHQTMSTMDGFSFTLIAHELAHQWFGDNVTCATWRDIWINEGFARYSEYVMLEKLHSRTEADAWMSVNYDDVLTQPSGSVYIPLAGAEDENAIFNFRLTYNKGGAILHMLRNVVNDDVVFFDAMKSFQDQFGGGFATGDDFKEVIEQKSGLALDNFFTEWYYGEGYPEYKIRWNYNSDTLYLKQIQTTSNALVPFFHLPMDYKVEFDDSEIMMIRVEAESADQVFKFYTGKTVKKITVDPYRWVLKKVTSFIHDSDLKAPLVVTSAGHDLRNDFDIYPNPADNIINIRANDTRPYDVEFMTMIGQSIIERKDQSGDTSLNATSLAPGVYILKIRSAKGTLIERVCVE